LFPRLRAASHLDFVFDAAESEEEELRDVGESVGLAPVDAILGEEVEEFAEGVVEVAGGLDFAGESGELPADFLGRAFALVEFGMIGTERGVSVRKKHAAAKVPRVAKGAAG